MGKIPEKISADVMFKSGLECCVCNKRGDHIHHINSNSSDNRFENLALLCFDHHDLATIKGSLKRKLSSQTIIKYRDHHYSCIDDKRKARRGSQNSFNTNIVTDLIRRSSLDALIIMDIISIREEYFEIDMEQRSNVLTKLSKYAYYSSLSVSIEVIDFLIHVGCSTRSGMENDISSSVLGLIIEFFPSNESLDSIADLARQCIAIGDNIAYDAILYINNIKVLMDGLTILKYIYRFSEKHQMFELGKLVKTSYKELRNTINRSDNIVKERYFELLEIFYVDLDKNGLSYPQLSQKLYAIIYENKNSSYED